MKGILTTEEKERKDKRNKVILGTILVFLMLMSTAGYAFFSGDQEINTSGEILEYKGVEFVKDQISNYWDYEINGYQFRTAYNPEEVSGIKNDMILTLADYQDKPFYYYFDNESEGQEAIGEIYNNLNYFILRAQGVCLKGTECNNELPIKSCSEDKIIIIKYEEELGVKQEEGCVTITGPQGEILKSSDSYIYKMMGLI
ncbi:hypothetical protein COU61_03565 [Candidatus Pacearchaeota archaeon CG10_big_fil_rev_8_21_14_0_10_35_13]|nr:MAG: hypothetical protein COU61_03565 [Candidatus Pacearchaeota archaeon CG10_big_fil_rev_8_21_14_0_10_35_13]